MDKEDFGNRITSIQGRMYHVACSYLQGEHDRMEAISETIFKAWAKRTTLKNQQYFSTWLLKILIRECINIQRRQKRVSPMWEIPEMPEQQRNESTDLRMALELLPQKLRITVVLHYMEGHSVAEIAEILNTTKGAVCSRLSRARKSLRDLLKEEIV